jgi:hypothetical protein
MAKFDAKTFNGEAFGNTSLEGRKFALEEEGIYTLGRYSYVEKI